MVSRTRAAPASASSPLKDTVGIRRLAQEGDEALMCRVPDCLAPLLDEKQTAKPSQALLRQV